jgi:hypothetical protein
MVSHESVCILNAGDVDAHAILTSAVIEPDVPIVVQQTRLDSRQAPGRERVDLHRVSRRGLMLSGTHGN